MYYDSSYSSDVFTCSKASFCDTVVFNNKKVQKYRRQTQFHIRESFIDFLDEKMFRGPKRKKKKEDADNKERYYQSSKNYLDYAKDLCKNFKRDLRIYSLCRKSNRLVGVAKADFPLLREDILFLHSMLNSELKDYKEFFIDHFQKGISMRQYAANKNINRGSVEYQQKKLYAKLAELLEERDLSDGQKRIGRSRRDYAG